jgi:hypothetical protein
MITNLDELKDFKKPVEREQNYRGRFLTRGGTGV